MASLGSVAQSLEQTFDALQTAHDLAATARRDAQAVQSGAAALELSSTTSAAGRVVNDLDQLADRLESLREKLSEILEQIEALRKGRSAGGSGSDRTKKQGARPPVAGWLTGKSRQSWVEQQLSDPTTSRVVTTEADWATYQRQVAGEREVRLFGGGRDIWADGLTVDPDAVVAAEAKFVARPGRSLYEGDLPPALAEELLTPFDSEMGRYAAVIRDPGNPIQRLRLIASTARAAQFLGRRARTIVGPTIDLQVVHVSPDDHPQQASLSPIQTSVGDGRQQT